jgi:predicted nucleic acid-binding protein
LTWTWKAWSDSEPMNDLVLIDTSVWIRYLRRDPDAEIVRRVREWLTAGQAATTPIIQIELLQATRTQAEFDQLSATLEALHPLAPDMAAWRLAARNAFMLRRAGVPIPTTDLLIATMAQQAQAELAHLDQHYELAAGPLALRTISFL